MSPELLEGHLKNKKIEKYNPYLSDLYSAGVTIL